MTAIKLKISCWLLGFLLITHLGAAVILYLTFKFGSSFWLGLFGVLLSLGYYIRQHIRQVKYLVWDSRDFLGTGFVSTGLMILKTSSGWFVLVKDMVDAETFRRLRVLLKTKAGHKRGREDLPPGQTLPS